MSLKFFNSKKSNPVPMVSKAQPSGKKMAKYVKVKNVAYEQMELCLKQTKDELKSSNCYGFVVAGYCPSHVEAVAQNSVADKSGLRKGDLIIKVNDVNCCRARIKSILTLIKSNNADILKLTIYRRLFDNQDTAKKLYTNTFNGKTRDTEQENEIKRKKNGSLISKWLRPSLWL
ncbi:regulator of G- signaling 3-like, partial [Brachionus plicatilis]